MLKCATAHYCHLFIIILCTANSEVIGGRFTEIQASKSNLHMFFILGSAIKIRIPKHQAFAKHVLFVIFNENIFHF
jgi:hypothetical protein